MKKALLELEDELKKADMFIEVRDARIPHTSHNTELLQHIPPKLKRIVVFNKMDLANERKTLAAIKQIESDHLASTGQKLESIHISTKKNQNINKLLQFVKSNVSPQFKTVGAWIMIGGIPNVGKSTVINALRSRDDEL